MNGSPAALTPEAGTEGQSSNADKNGEEPKPRQRKPGFWYYQDPVKDFYLGTHCQVFVAVLIFMNFSVTVIQAQVDPWGGTPKGHYNDVWYIIDAVFTTLFSIELLVNMYGQWWKLFWFCGWNVFDFIVVSVSILVIFWEDMPGELQLIKLLRAFRVFRLFNRVPSMRKILQSLGKAVPGMVSAFGINLLMLCIYSVLAVDLYKDLYSNDCKNQTIAGPSRPGAITARGSCYGNDYYGNFFRSIYTLFQVLTGESWSEAAVRPIFAFWEGENNDLYLFLSAAFFVSFIVINAFVLLNVVVALLMDGMSQGKDDPPSEGEPADQSQAQDEDQALDLPIELNAMQTQVGGQGRQLGEQKKQLVSMIEILEDIKKSVGSGGNTLLRL